MPTTKPKPTADGNPHAGHRERLKARFRKGGLEAMEPHTRFELLLCYGIPRRDINEEAHRLLDTFGSLQNIFDAPLEELTKVEGITESAATLIKMIPAFCQLYYEAKVEDGPGEGDNLTHVLAQRLIAKTIAEVNEVAYAVCLDNRLRILCMEKLGEGTASSVSILTRKIVELAIRSNATGVILAHNHPTGMAMPSPKDKNTTWQIYNALAAVSVKLLDHLILARNEYLSMASAGMLSQAFMTSNRSGHSLADETYPYPEEDYDWREEL